MTTTDEMVERAANSDARFDGFQGGLQDVPRQRKDRYRARARAALTAALGDSVVVPREATEAMLDAGTALSGDGIPDDDYRDDFRAAYQRMVAAAPAASQQDSTP